MWCTSVFLFSPSYVYWFSKFSMDFPDLYAATLNSAKFKISFQIFTSNSPWCCYRQQKHVTYTCGWTMLITSSSVTIILSLTLQHRHWQQKKGKKKKIWQMDSNLLHSVVEETLVDQSQLVRNFLKSRTKIIAN